MVRECRELFVLLAMKKNHQFCRWLKIIWEEKLSKLRMLKKKNFLTLLLTKGSTDLSKGLNTSLELISFLLRYSFLLTDKPQENLFLKRDFPPPGDISTKNPKGARYLDPKYSRWMSADPALDEYVPQAPINDEAKKHNENLPGMGGLFNSVNLSLYHYAGNNPIRYTDPDGKIIKDKETEIHIQKIFENTKKYMYTQKTIEEFEKNLVWARGGKTKIGDLINISDDTKRQIIVLDLLQQSAESDVELVEVKIYKDAKVGKEVAEYWIVTYDSDTEKPGFIYNVFVDIGNDGYIDYAEWIPQEMEKEMAE